MTITQIEENINKLLSKLNQEQFIFDFLLSYGEPKATITRLKKSDLNQLKSKNELFNTEKRDDSVPAYLKSFPYVNGGLFESSYEN